MSKQITNECSKNRGRDVSRQQSDIPFSEAVPQESHTHCKAIIDLVPCLICSFLPGGQIAYVNSAYCDYFGKNSDELIGSSFLSLIPGSDHETVMNNISALTTHSPTQIHEHPVYASSKEVRWQRWTNRAIFDDWGNVVCYHAIGEDITEQKLAKKALHQSEELHRIILGSISDAVFITDDDGVFTFVCPNVSVIFGHSYAETIALKTIEQLMGEKLVDAEKIRNRREIKNIEHQILDKSGSPHDLLVNVKRVSIQGGTILYTCRDVTDRKKAEKELGIQKDFLHSLLETLPNPVFYKDINGRYLGCNEAFETFVGRARSDIIGKTVYGLGPRGIADKYREMDAALLKQSGQQKYEWRVQGADKSMRDVIFDKATINDSHGNIIGLVGVITDITERKKSERALKKSESMLKAILSASPIGICLVRNRILEWTNDTLYRIWGHETGSLLGQDTRILYPTEDEYDRVGREFYSTIERDGLAKIETQWVKKNGEVIHCYLQGCQLDPSDSEKGCIIASVDITERKRIERLVRNLSYRLIEAQEDERKMIAYELHDSIAQNLSYLKINCDTFFDDHPSIKTGLKRKMRKQSKLIENTINAVKELSYGLHPPSLDLLGITQSIYQLCDEFSELTGLSIDFVPTGVDAIELDTSSEINLYRLVQEGLSNIRKHAQATHVKIVLVASYPNIILRIQDDGKGFDVRRRALEVDGSRRMGLRSMTERVNFLQGTIKIKSLPGVGTKIFIKIPLA
jgi:PAS domain S-box-containing protein